MVLATFKAMTRHKWKLTSKQTEKKYRTDTCEVCGCERKYYKKYKYRLNKKVTSKPPVCVG
jgi:ribosomal protein S14